MKLTKYTLISGNLFLFISGELLICRHTEEMTARILLSAVLIGFCLMNLGSYVYFRSQFVALSSQICRYSEEISEITHQIKTPLSNVKMYCEMYTDMENCAEQSGQFRDVMKQQRVAIARALAAKPAIILADANWTRVLDGI